MIREDEHLVVIKLSNAFKYRFNNLGIKVFDGPYFIVEISCVSCLIGCLHMNEYKIFLVKLLESIFGFSGIVSVKIACCTGNVNRGEAKGNTDAFD